MRKIKNIVILAGGDSTRFWPLKNKNLYKFIGTPLIKYQTERIKEYCDNLIIVAHEDNIEDIKRVCLFKVIVQKDNLPGQAGAIISAKNLISGEVLIVNANDIFNPEAFQQLNIKLKQGANMVFMAKKVNEYFPGGYFKLKGKKVIEIVEKPDPKKTPSNIVRLVCDYFRNYEELVGVLISQKSKAEDLYERGINILLEKTHGADYILYNDYWHTIKYPWHVLSIMRYFLLTLKENKIEKNVTISRNSIIIPPVYIGDDVKIGDFTKVVGPCYIGSDTTIGDFCLIRESHIGKNSLIGGYSEITRSYLGNKVTLHRNYVGDTILDNGVEMGAQTVTANFRFDKRTVTSMVNNHKIDSNMIKLGAIIGHGSKIGVNSSILPGVKIGKNTFIGPKEIVTEDVNDNMFVFEGKTKKNKYNK